MGVVVRGGELAGAAGEAEEALMSAGGEDAEGEGGGCKARVAADVFSRLVSTLSEISIAAIMLAPRKRYEEKKRVRR